MLVGLIVAIFIILLVMGVAAPQVARGLRREREVETIHRGNQYVRAIQLYYKKFQHYPGSLEQLEKTNNVRFLRQRYADPMTGKADWRLIKVGEAKTTVKGFFGQPLAGLPAAGMGGGIGSGISGSTGSTGSAFGTAGASGTGSAFGSPGAGGSGSTFGSTNGASTAGTGSSDPSGAGGSSGSTGSTGGIGSQSATTFSGTGAPFVGVGSSKSGESITVLNEQPSYQTWEFIYDPRIEQLKAKASLFGGGPATSSGSGLGSGIGSGLPGQGGTPTNSFGTPGSSTNGSPGSATPSSPSVPSTTPQ
jgi:type II secretory pathway pseudopilin PulG